MKRTNPQLELLLATLKARFEQNMNRHREVDWPTVRARLDMEPGKLKVLQLMEQTGGEPDVIGRDATTGEILFCDCSPESPAGRRSLCYDGEARETRKAHQPVGSAVELATTIGVKLLTATEYRGLQELGCFDVKTSSWLSTPPEIRMLGGALFGDRRYDTVFIYHNGAQSYYAARGFRGLARV